MTHEEGLGSDPSMPSPFKSDLVLQAEDAETAGVWLMVPKSHRLVMCPST
jgi:hypothetical protein